MIVRPSEVSALPDEGWAEVLSPSLTTRLPAAFALVAVMAILVVLPAATRWTALAETRLALRASARLVVARGVHAPAAAPAEVLAMLAQDPSVRAAAAVYRAALLRPERRAGLDLSPSAATPHDQIAQAAWLVDRLLAPSAGADVLDAGGVDLRSAIAQASRMAGVDETFMRRTAMRESGLNTYAIASSSSARGLFQFVDQTWLSSVAKWGARHGLAREAAAVRFGPGGRAYVADPREQRAILMLRYKPAYSARLAAELVAENAAVLREGLGRPAGSRELYAAHLLGPTGALRLIRTAEVRPATPAAALFPGAAAKNPRLFYRAGVPRSVSELLLSLS